MVPWTQPQKGQKAPPLGYQVSDDTNYPGVYPSKHRILWNRITMEEEDARVLHILLVTQQYAKGYFRVLEWYVQHFRNSRHTIQSILILASQIVLLHLAEHRGTLWCMMAAADPLNDLEALCTHTAVWGTGAVRPRRCPNFQGKNGFNGRRMSKRWTCSMDCS